MIPPILFSRDESGFTLLELSIALLIICLLLGFAIPSFQAWQKKSYREALTQELMSAIELAKSEAIKRNKRILLCGSEDTFKCSTNWSNGFILFAANGYSSQPQSRDDIIRVWSKIKKGILIWRGLYSFIDVHPAIWGRAMAGSFYYSVEGDEVGPKQFLVINRVGRTRIVE